MKRLDLRSTAPHLRLLATLAARMTRERLLHVATGDDADDVDEHATALVALRDTLVVPEAFSWHPGEVLALYRWTRPGRNPAQSPYSAPEQHEIRAFCCTALLLQASGEEAFDETLFALAASLLEIDPERDLMAMLSPLLDHVAGAYDELDGSSEAVTIATVRLLVAMETGASASAVCALLDAAVSLEAHARTRALEHARHRAITLGSVAPDGPIGFAGRCKLIGGANWVAVAARLEQAGTVLADPQHRTTLETFVRSLAVLPSTS